MGVTIHLEKMTTEVVRDGDQVLGLAFKDGSTLDCDLVVVSAGIRPNSEIGMRCGLTAERAHRGRRPHALGGRSQRLRRRRMRPAPRQGLRSGRAALGPGQGASPTSSPARNPTAAYFGSKLATKLKVMGVELASMGATGPTDDDDEVVQFSEPKRGIYKKLIIRDGRLIGAIMLGDLDKAAYLMQAFDRNTPLPEERLSLLFDIGAPAKAVSFEEMPDDTQVCNCNGVSKGAIGACVDAAAPRPPRR